MTTIATFISQQIWPQLHFLSALKPTRLILLHSANEVHSRGPALRLQAQLTRWHRDLQLPWVPKQCVCREISDHDFAAVQQELSAVHTEFPLTALHLTGGNKLMGFAAFEWAQQQRLPVVYLERQHGFQELSFGEEGLQSKVLTHDPHVLDALDPAETVRCQLEEGEIEREGELLVLSEKGKKMGLKELGKLLNKGDDCLSLIEVLGEADAEFKQGDLLELQTATTLLKLGVPMISRSLRLKASETQAQRNSEPYQELDLLFHHQGRLWLVDCKDRHAQSQYNDKGYKALMEDVAGARSMGGLSAKILCVRKAKFTVGQTLFAKDHGIEYINRDQLISDLQKLLCHEL